jgi:acyl carrier protein
MSLIFSVSKVVASVLEVDVGSIDSQSGLGKTPKWDSLNHAKLVLELEDAFDVDFDFKELDQLITVDRIVTSLEEKGVKG